MLEYIKGVISELTPAYAVIETGGIGYMATITVATYTDLSNMNGEVKLLLHEVIREDAHLLFGFSSARERELFRLLIGVSGVGPTTAVLILSGLTVPELEAVITSGDHSRLKNVKGIGVKTAQRIIVDLKDKIKPSAEALSIKTESDPAAAYGEVFEEALAAMLALGFPKPQSVKVLRRIFDADPAVKVDVAIKKALAMI
ncbi:MAG: Holliday junction branch migration protein RuvA [Duncaniella sp.]|nr:Holliday junction branch migration protein RuvA [Duncaniella sp.]